MPEFDSLSLHDRAAFRSLIQPGRICLQFSQLKLSSQEFHGLTIPHFQLPFPAKRPTVLSFSFRGHKQVRLLFPASFSIMSRTETGFRSLSDSERMFRSGHRQRTKQPRWKRPGRHESVNRPGRRIEMKQLIIRGQRIRKGRRENARVPGMSTGMKRRSYGKGEAEQTA